MELTQILLVTVIVILTILLTIVGIEVFLVLKELRKSIKKTNKILDNNGDGFIDSFKKTIDVATKIPKAALEDTKEFIEKVEKQETVQEVKENIAKLEEKAKEIINEPKRPIGNFFKRGGKKLKK